MGLLSDEDGEEDINLAESVFRDLLLLWDQEFRGQWGYALQVTGDSVRDMCDIASLCLFTGTSLPSSPGPFKRAAAFSLLLRQNAEVRFIPDDDNVELTESQATDWKAKLALFSIPLVLKICTIKGKPLEKEWKTATPHLRKELLNWLRWMEPPLDEDGYTQIDRLLRSILIYSMVIEQSYYLVDAEKECDLKGTLDCDISPQGSAPSEDPNHYRQNWGEAFLQY